MLGKEGAAILYSTALVVPFVLILFLKRRYHFEGMLPLTLFVVAPMPGVFAFILLLFHGFSILYGLMIYFIGITFFGAGWGALLGVVGWVLGSRIQTRAKLPAAPRFLIGGCIGLLFGAILLPSYCLLLGVSHSLELLWIVPGAISGAVAGIIVVSFVPDASEKPSYPVESFVRQFR